MSEVSLQTVNNHKREPDRFKQRFGKSVVHVGLSEVRLATRALLVRSLNACTHSSRLRNVNRKTEQLTRSVAGLAVCSDTSVSSSSSFAFAHSSDRKGLSSLPYLLCRTFLPKTQAIVHFFFKYFVSLDFTVTCERKYFQK